VTRPLHPLFREGGVSYLRIPAPDPAALATFYGAVFGWQIRPQAGSIAFSDGGGAVIGHFRSDLPVAPGAGFTPSVYVADIDATLAQAVEEGASVATEPYPEGDLWVATLLDPAGNTVGCWQRGPRHLGGA
jgi:hypothetical protein